MIFNSSLVTSTPDDRLLCNSTFLVFSYATLPICFLFTILGFYLWFRNLSLAILPLGLLLVDSIELANRSTEDNRCACGVNLYHWSPFTFSVVFFELIHKLPRIRDDRVTQGFKPYITPSFYLLLKRFDFQHLEDMCAWKLPSWNGKMSLWLAAPSSLSRL
jgi:hypothetical protein